MNFTHICKNCFKPYKGKPEVCPNCGEKIEYKKKKQPKDQQESLASGQEIKEDKPKKIKKNRRLSSKEIMDTINFDDLLLKTNDTDVKSWRDRRKKKERIQADYDENGEINIDVKDVSYLPETYTYSVKKARGEYKKTKLKWWEVYKWADMMLARRKIKKQVSKASTYKPEPIRNGAMLTLCILFGWLGAHNFYARNYRKAWFVLLCLVLGSVVVFVPAFAPVRVSIGGGLLFINVFMWGLDIINLIVGHYSYRLSKWKFIDNLNIDTRAKLGYKYIDINEYKKPWIVRVIGSWKEASAESKRKKQQAKQARQAEQTSAEDQPNQQVQIEQVSDSQKVIENENNSAKKSSKKSKIVKKQVKIVKNNK